MGWDLCAGLFYEHRFAMLIIDFIENVPQVGCQKALYCKTYARFEVTL